jgi:uncharacterized protein
MEEITGNIAMIKPIIGGILIGIASIGMMLFNGRVAGISGILKGILQFPKNDLMWRVSFVAGMILTGLVFNFASPGFAVIEINRSLVAYGVAGLLIGIGTGLANGCTSGHGVCGVGRLSNRSVTVTMAFTVSGIVTVWAINTFFGGVI